MHVVVESATAFILGALLALDFIFMQVLNEVNDLVHHAFFQGVHADHGVQLAQRLRNAVQGFHINVVFHVFGHGIVFNNAQQVGDASDVAGNVDALNYQLFFGRGLNTRPHNVRLVK